MANKLEKGCTFGLVLQQRVIGMEDKLADGFDRIDNRLSGIEEKNKEMFNHMSSRPTTESARNDKIIFAIMGGLGAFALTLISLLFYGFAIS